ncbi:MAG: CheR family methyltransferase [Polyangiaceae bacterium]
MIHSISTHDVNRFRDLIARRFGLSFDDTRSSFLADLIQRGADATRSDVRGYLDAVDASERDVLRELAQWLTVSETYFFRNREQFDAFSGIVLPERISARSETRTLRILSAGCSSGEEPYSLAILLRERCLDAGWNLSIRAIDLNPTALAKAASGRYSAWSLRETPEDVRRRWFSNEGRDWHLAQSIRDGVTFEEKNLSFQDPSLWPHGVYDVVFCRNVLMYFVPEAARRIVARIAGSLAPGGYLFLGHAETLRGLSHDFHLRHTHRTFYYQRKEALESEQPSPSDIPLSFLAPTPTPTLSAPLPASLDWTTTWLDTVQNASDRIHALAAAPKSNVASQASEKVTNGGARKANLAPALDLLREERFADALASIDGEPEDLARDSDALLLSAVLLTHRGDVERAEKACARLLDVDDMNAGAHYLLALCRENAGDARKAFDHDQIAGYLDPTFAMPRLHLGLLARRAGDRATAQRELDRAIVLLEREDASRLLLFGGGFNRDGLVALCRAELRKLEGTR